MPAHLLHRLVGALTCTVISVAAIAGCTSESEPDAKTPGPSSSPEDKASPRLAPAKFSTLPAPCSTVSGDTIDAVVPEAQDKKGKSVGLSAPGNQGSCLWTGVKVSGDDYQFRSLSVSLKHYASQAGLGSGDERATDYYGQQVAGVKDSSDGKKDIKERRLEGVGNEATAIAFRSSKKDSKGKSTDYREERIVVRVANAVVTVDYQGAGFEGSKLPSAATVSKNAEKVAKEAVAALK